MAFQTVLVVGGRRWAVHPTAGIRLDGYSARGRAQKSCGFLPHYQFVRKLCLARRWSSAVVSPKADEDLTIHPVTASSKTEKQAKPVPPAKTSSKGSKEAQSASKYEAVIGIETHVQLATRTKAFCRCSTTYGVQPNSNVCPVCLAYPGVLPVLNQSVLEYAVKAALALGSDIARVSKFDRKQYFYPDLPKNYQISQYDVPIATKGTLSVPVGSSIPGRPIRNVRVGITRLHMEEDAGKLSHVAGSSSSSNGSGPHALIDFNRSGVPLIEIVSEPDMSTGEEAAEYAQELRRIMRYLGVSDGNMQEGSLRCDVNISVRERGAKEFGTKVELKNMNSFNAIQRAIDYEIDRQSKLLDEGGTVEQETRTWDDAAQSTRLMRKKGGSADYRYFPEPDLPPVFVSEAQLSQWRSELPQLPASRRQRFEQELGLPQYDAAVLTDDKQVCEYFEATVAAGGLPKPSANWLLGEILGYINANKSDIVQVSELFPPQQLAELVALIDKGTISGKIGKELLADKLAGAKETVTELISKKGLTQISDEAAIVEAIDSVLANNPKELELFRGGNTKLQGFFVGQVMKLTGGRADPKLTNKLLAQKLRG